MRLVRPKRIVQSEIQASGSNFGAWRVPAAAGIKTIKAETVHKSTFALMGQAVPVSAFATLTAGISSKSSKPALCTRSL
jgi:hypothetical protein